MQKSVLFVKAKSRLGLIHPPNRETDLNIGVETGPDSILSDTFIKHFPQSEVVSFEFTPPEDIKLTDYFEVLAKEYAQFIELIAYKLDGSKTLVTIGGDHSISLGSIATVLKIFDPATTGIIMIDSHGDIHQPNNSPSGNFHGMWLRPLIDKFDIKAINALVPNKVPPKNLLYIGNLDIEVEEKIYMRNNHIDTYSQTKITNPTFAAKLDSFMHAMEHIHISIDIDAFSHMFAPATGMIIKNGLSPVDICPILKKLRNFKSLSVDLVEVNPSLDGSAKTIQFSQELLQMLLL